MEWPGNMSAAMKILEFFGLYRIGMRREDSKTKQTVIFSGQVGKYLLEIYCDVFHKDSIALQLRTPKRRQSRGGAVAHQCLHLHLIKEGEVRRIGICGERGDVFFNPKFGMHSSIGASSCV